MTELLLYQRPDGREASRTHLVVIPSVVCANAVAAQIASRVGARSVSHQHGCAQIGDDASATSHALAELASHPNAWATLVVSLGCETLQGLELVERLQRNNVICHLVGIQGSGGSTAAIEAGVGACSEFPPTPLERRAPRGPVCVGLAFVGNTEELAQQYADALAATGFVVDEPIDASRAPILTLTETASARDLLGMVLVADRGFPTGPVLVPLLAIAATTNLFEDADGEYDMAAPSAESLVAACTKMLAGRLTRAEKRGDAYFAIRRTLLTL